MPISENMVQEIVQQVMAKMQIADTPAGKQHGVFKDMNGSELQISPVLLFRIMLTDGTSG